MSYAKFPPTGSGGGGGGSGDIEGVTAGAGLTGGGTSGTVTVALDTVTADRALVSDVSGYPAAATTTATEIGYVNGVTSAIQTQLDAKTTASSTTTFTNKTFDADGSGNSITNIENADIKAAAAIALNKLAATTASRALVSDGSGFVSAATTTSTEIGYVNGVTSAIQTQLNGKQTTALTDTQILVGNGSNVAAAVAMSGDATIANTGAVTVASAAGNFVVKAGSELRLNETDNGNYVGFKAPTLSANKVWTLPTADGTNGQVLQTNGSAVLSWATASGGSFSPISWDTAGSQTLTSAQHGTTFCDTTSGLATYTAPATATSGLMFYIRVGHVDGAKFLCDSGDTISMNGVASASTGYIQSFNVGDFACIQGDGTNWHVLWYVGNWQLV